MQRLYLLQAQTCPVCLGSRIVFTPNGLQIVQRIDALKKAIEGPPRPQRKDVAFHAVALIQLTEAAAEQDLRQTCKKCAGQGVTFERVPITRELIDSLAEATE